MFVFTFLHLLEVINTQINIFLFKYVILVELSVKICCSVC